MDEDKNKKRLKARIHRVVYTFNISKLFTPVKRFVKRTDELTPEVIRSYLSSIFKPKKDREKEKGARQKFRVPAAIGPSGPMSQKGPSAILIAIAAIFLILLYGVYVYFRIGAQPPVIPPSIAKPIPPSFDAFLGEAGYLDAGTTTQTKWYAFLDLTASDLDKITATFIVQEDSLPAEIFILRTDNYQFADRYTQFYPKLKERLAERGLTVSEISVKDLLAYPASRKMILIVPSGNIPALLLGQEFEEFDMKKFTRAGNVIVYIGLSPIDGALIGSSVIPQPISEDVLKTRFGLSFGKEPSGSKPKRFTFSEALYNVQVASGEGIERPTIVGQTGEYTINWGGGGYVYMLPTSIDFWWAASGERSAKELADVVAEGYWGKDLTRGNLEIQSVNSTIAPFRTSILTSTFIPRGQEFRPTKSAGRIYIQAIKTIDNVTAVSGKSFQVSFGDRPRGTIEHDQETVSTALTEQPLELRYSLSEPGSGAEQLFLSIVNKNGVEVQFSPITAQPVSLRLSRATYRFDNTLPSNDYILRITNGARNVYAQSYLHVSGFRVNGETLDFASGRFTFLIYKDVDKEPYPARLRHVTVSIDGKDEKEVEASAGRFQYNTGPITTFGNHTVSVKLGTDSYPLSIAFSREASIFEKPENIAAIVITLILFGIGVLITRPEEIRYALDVPDFPPLQAIAIPLKRDVVLEVFDSVNKDLRWQFTPLSIVDLKAGFKKVLHRGRSVAIGDYNLERILDKLIEEGYVVKSLDYYGLRKWEKESGKSIHTLAMTRSLRDIFVNEGIPFVPFGQKTEADTLISIGGEKVYVHIYEDDKVISRAITTALTSRTVVVFEDEVVMRSFMDRIHSASEINVTFKLLVENKKINLAPVNKLMDVLSKRYTFHY